MQLCYKWHVGKIVSKCLSEGIRRCGAVLYAGRSLGLYHDPIELVVVRVEFVKAEFFWNNEEDYQTGTDTDAQAEDIYERVISIPGKIPKRY